MKSTFFISNFVEKIDAVNYFSNPLKNIKDLNSRFESHLIGSADMESVELMEVIPEGGKFHLLRIIDFR